MTINLFRRPVGALPGFAGPGAALARAGLALALWCASTAGAGTLDDASHRGTIRFGYWPGEVPFSDHSASRVPVGYSVDLCRRVAEIVGAALGKPLRAEWVEINADTRFSFLDNGTIDLACADITNTRARQEKYAFSHTIFVAGTRLIAKASHDVPTWDSLQGKAVGVVGNTTGEKLVKDLDENLGLHLRIVTAKSLREAWDLLEKDQVEAVGYDDILLSNLAAKSPAGADAFRFAEGYLSVEPYGLMMRRGDDGFRKRVNDALASIYASGEIEGIYNRWFMNADRRVPKSMHLREDFMLPNAYPAFP